LNNACVGQPVYLVVQCIDNVGNPLTGDPAASWSTSVAQGPSSYSAAITEQSFNPSNGEVALVFTLGMLGAYLLTIQANGIPIAGSPYNAYYTGPDPPQCYASIAGSATASVGSQQSFTIQAVAPDGSKLTTGAAGFVAVATDPTATVVPTSTADNGDGTYTTTFTLTALGTWTFDVQVCGQEIMGSPYTVTYGPKHSNCPPKSH